MSRFDEYDGPSRDEIAREVLDADEYGAWREVEAERARVRSVARRNRDRLMRSVGDVWADDYRGRRRERASLARDGRGAMRLLDLFCGEGGAAAGYQRAGWTVTGVDLKASAAKRYPGEFIQADALAYLAEHGREYDAIHASPPCQGYSIATAGNPTARAQHVRLIAATRELLRLTGRPWVIEPTCAHCGSPNDRKGPGGTPMRYCSKSCGDRAYYLRLRDGGDERTTRRRIYGRWYRMVDRCTNPENPHWHRYGGRGIRVCDEWMTFENYMRDTGLPPKPGMTLDRIDNNGPYSPDNVRWATPKQQRANIEFDPQASKTHCAQGHAYDESNTYVSPRGWRECRACHREKMRRRRAA